MSLTGLQSFSFPSPTHRRSRSRSIVRFDEDSLLREVAPPPIPPPAAPVETVQLKELQQTESSVVTTAVPPVPFSTYVPRAPSPSILKKSPSLDEDNNGSRRNHYSDSSSTNLRDKVLRIREKRRHRQSKVADFTLYLQTLATKQEQQKETIQELQIKQLQTMEELQLSLDTKKLQVARMKVENRNLEKEVEEKQSEMEQLKRDYQQNLREGDQRRQLLQGQVWSLESQLKQKQCDCSIM